MEILNATKPKARKEHTCDLCGLNIHIGETYANETILYDGEIHSFKRHLSCDELAQKLRMYDDCDGITSDDFIEYVYEEYMSTVNKTEIEQERFNPVSFQDQLDIAKKKHGILN